ncbi:TRAP transporter small permease [Vibrio hangzhouensis]|uniref:TRAP transporter small permease protein n=1 Tax=Vibrio hangzhouensis TaxID=462991 RepID=A0A1H6AYT6_9VIBR|nr:TRAP transporter small permease [Vibrio hangzhouensis]SEG53534.1 TRAP-type C4-dicarboxylate transport system, small permease component [Vibrio hangzhouensis]
MNGFSVAKTIRRGLETLAAISLLLMMLITFVDVTGRYFFNAPVVGSTELIEVLLAVMVFMAFPLVSWNEENICVDLLDNYFPKKWIGIRQIVINLICSCSLILVALMNWKLAGRSMEYEEVTEILEMPLGYVTYLISVTGFVGGVLTGFNALVYARKLFSGSTGADTIDTKSKEA